jgi:hypothetical protein
MTYYNYMVPKYYFLATEHVTKNIPTIKFNKKSCLVYSQIEDTLGWCNNNCYLLLVTYF